ncbi:MAG: amidohydrolase family protein, partial [Endozoicomonas sp.]
MSLLHPKNRAALVEAALGERPFDLVIENIRLLNVFTRELYPARVGIYDGFIAHVEPVIADEALEPMAAKEVWDGEDSILAPGYIDAHMHIESTMMTPRNFTATALPWGTTTVVTDPHESANVIGKRAVKYMLDASEDLPMRHFVLAPSCVPAMPELENSGASFDAGDIAELMEHDRVLGLAEVMDYVGVLRNNPRMRSILEKALEKGAFVQGHAPRINKRELSAYLCAGPVSCHESHQGSEAREKIRQGMFVDARESSMSANVKSLVSGLAGLGAIPDRFTLCTDNVEPGDLLQRGHMNHVVHTAFEAGMDPVNAIVCATYNVAKEIGIRGLGAIAPGYVADMQILPTLHSKRPSAVFYRGRLVAADGWLLGEMPGHEHPEEK